MEENKIDRRKITLIVLGVAILIVLVVGITYAFFQNQIGEPATGNVGVDTDTPDNLQFNVSNDISININQFNFGPDAGNQSDDAVATATLLANSTNDTATYTYYVYFKINNNNYVYTTGDQKPEIILTVTDPTGAPVTEVEGLTYNQELGGFDITTANGTFAVASQYTITSNSSVTPTTQNWNFTATFINLDTDQGENAGKKMDAEIIIQQNELKPTLAEYIISQYTGTDGENDLYYHDADLANSAGDNSYRYAGASSSVNNYVCFGSDASPCPSANLYRIIGVFGSEVKLIKNTSYGSYAWETDWSTQGNTWNSSTKPDIYTTLNTTFLNTLSSTWQNKIATHSYEVGGGTNANIRYYPNGIPANAYRNEVVANQTGYAESMKIGLMYVSDYYYGASPTYWTYPGYTSSSYPDANGNSGSSYDYRAATGSNWMYLGSSEWTISRILDGSDSAFRVDSTGYVNVTSVNFARAVRPVFYLTSSISYVSGSGSSADPMRIN